MSEGQVVLCLYTALLAITAGDIAGPKRLRRQRSADLPPWLLLAVRAVTVATFALVAWVVLTDDSAVIALRETLVWILLLVEGLVFIQIAEHRDRGFYSSVSKSTEAAHGAR